MVPRHLWRDIALACAFILSTACLPPDDPKKPAAPADELARTWVIADHILSKGSSMSPADAEGFHGRTIQVSAAGYVSPWQGTCEEAGRTRRDRSLSEVIDELEMSPSAQGEARGFGMKDMLVEYRLSCTDGGRKPPPLTVYISAGKAMTCFNGVCYLMKPF